MFSAVLATIRDFLLNTPFACAMLAVFLMACAAAGVCVVLRRAVQAAAGAFKNFRESRRPDEALGRPHVSGVK
jgi:hypothetical protein